MARQRDGRFPDRRGVRPGLVPDAHAAKSAEPGDLAERERVPARPAAAQRPEGEQKEELEQRRGEEEEEQGEEEQGGLVEEPRGLVEEPSPT